MPLNNPSTNQALPSNPPTIANPSSPTTIEDLRAKVAEILQALRNANIIAPLQFAARIPSRLDALTYDPVNNASYTYYSSAYEMPKIRDGVTNAGMMANQSKVFVQVQLAASAYLNRIQLYAGQFNGAYNLPKTFRVYEDFVTVDTGIPLYEGTIAVNTSMQSFDVSTIPGFNTPGSTFTFVFFNSSNGTNVSVNELQLFGQSV
jgi:hypothetical protein